MKKWFLVENKKMYLSFQKADFKPGLMSQMFRGKRMIRIRPLDEQVPVMYSRRSPKSGNKSSSKPRFMDPLRARVWRTWTYMSNLYDHVVRVRGILLRAITRKKFLSMFPKYWARHRSSHALSAYGHIWHSIIVEVTATWWAKEHFLSNF